MRVLEKGFDGHNFISGLNSHLRDLLVSRDEVTLRLLEATPSVRQRYLAQTKSCSEEFLFRALDAGSNCDVNYKTSKNPRLHVELFLIRLCRLSGTPPDESEKKRSDVSSADKKPEDIPVPSRSEIIRETEEPHEIKVSGRDASQGKHAPVIDKPKRSISIKNIISDERKAFENDSKPESQPSLDSPKGPLGELSASSFEKAWAAFTDQVKGDGTRVVSMFKSIRTELENDKTIILHLTNAAQKDLFNQNYRQKLLGFLANKLDMKGADIETVVDLSETNDILYTDEQKYNYLSSKYPGMKDFRKAFNLDIT